MMAADNLFQQYLRPPKSVMEYSAEYDQADARKQSLQQNALELAAGQQKYDDGVQARARADQLRQTLMGLPVGATDDQRIQVMRGAGTQEGFAAADALEKSLGERRKTTSAAKKDDAETAEKEYKLKIAKHDQALRDMSSFQSPQDALLSLQQHVTSGELAPEQAQMFASQLQAMNPKDFPAWQLSMVRRLMSAADEMKYRAPDANTVANNARAAAEGAANRSNQIKIQNMIGERQDRAADDASGLSDATKLRIAQQFVDAGDVSGLKNLGRGTQGAKDLRGIQNAITDYAAQKGMSPSEISAKIADFDGLKVGLRTSANISARVENAIAEADELAPLAIEAGRRVARSGFLPFGRAQVMFNNQTNDPDMNRFATANIGLATAYAGAMARGQKPTVHDKEHAEKVIGEAKSQQAYEAVVDQLILEMAAAKRAPHKVRDSLRGEISGKGGLHAASAPTQSTSTTGSSSDIEALLKKYGGK